MSLSSCGDSLAQDVVYCREEQSALYLELGHVSLYYFEYDSAKVHTQDMASGGFCLTNSFGKQGYFEKASFLAHVSAQLTGICGLDVVGREVWSSCDVGALGRRTKYQQTDVAQLVMKVSTSPTHNPKEDPKEGVAAHFPKEVAVDDDTILDKISFKVTRPLDSMSGLQQAALLALG